MTTRSTSLINAMRARRATLLAFGVMAVLVALSSVVLTGRLAHAARGIGFHVALLSVPLPLPAGAPFEGPRPLLVPNAY
jgi:ABC-type xylose transport system permease subunit